MLVNTLAASTHFECFITTPHSWVFLIGFFIVFLGPLWGIWVTLMGQAEHLQEQHYPFLQVSVIFSCIQTRIWPPVFNVRSNIDACSCTWGLYWHHNRVCTGRWLWEKIPLLHWVLEPASVSHPACQSYMLYSLSYLGPVRLITRSGHMVASLTLTIVWFCWAVKKHWETDPSQSAVYIY